MSAIGIVWPRWAVLSVLGFLLVTGYAPVLGQASFTFSTLRSGDETVVRDCDGKPVGGTNYLVQVLVKNPQTGRWSPNLERVSANGVERVKPVPLLEGRGLGRFSGGTIRVPFLSDGQEAEVWIRIWDVRTGDDFPSAKVRGDVRTKVRVVGVGEGVPGFPVPIDDFQAPRLCSIEASEKT